MIRLLLLLAAAEPLGFQSRVEPGKAHLGEPFTYELVITHPKDHRYELVVPSDLGAFELLHQKRSRIDGKDSATTTFQVQMSAFELGLQTLPDLPFELVKPDGTTDRFTAPGRQVEIESALPKDADEKGADLYDIRPPEEVPVRTWRLLWVLAGTLAAALLAYALYKYAKRPRPAAAVPAAPLKPLHERTLAALDALRTENLPGQGRVKEFYLRLSEVLRGYLGERYQFEALESTTGELLESLRTLHTPGLPMEELAGFCYRADLVKFAKGAATPDECKESLEFAYRVVTHTTPLLAVQPAPLPPPPTQGHGNERHVP